jgi:hypothetical protein
MSINISNRRIIYSTKASTSVFQAPDALLLHDGNGGTPMVRLNPVRAPWPRMWRMHWPDGRVSDMDNLSRTRDAAAAICERGPPTRDRLTFKWTRIYREFPHRRDKEF